MIIEALKKLGPCLSTSLIDRLASAGVARATARKRLSRDIDAGAVEVIEDLKFAHGARFVYLRTQKTSLAFMRALRDVVLAEGGAYARAVQAVQARRVVPKWQFAAASGAPLQRKGHLTPEKVLERLVAAGLFVEEDVDGLGPAVAMGDRSRTIPSADAAGAIARSVTETLLLDMVREWARRHAFSSWEATTVRRQKRPPPEAGSYAWDLTSPCYLLPLTGWSGGKKTHGFFVCDVLLAGKITENGVSAFLHKCGSLRHLRVGPVLPLFVADSYEQKAFNLVKAAGVIPATIDSLFGKDAAAAFQELARVITDALKGNLDAAHLADVVRRLAKVEGALGNLQGALFEFIVAEIVRHEVPSARLELNRHCKDRTGKSVEVDIWALDTNIARFVECKGREPTSEIADAEIDQWLDIRIPAVRHHLEQLAQLASVPRPTFELWATGRLSDKSMERIKRTRTANSRKFDLIVIDAKGVKEKALATLNKALVDTLQQLFKDTPG